MYDFTQQYGLFITVNGRRITEYHHNDGLCYIEGRKGTEYELELVNDSYERILMIPSVDGLSVIDGNIAGTDSPGYVVSQRSSISIPGWKLNVDEAAKFVFDNAKSSYTKRSGKGTRNVGAIGALVFREKLWEGALLGTNIWNNSLPLSGSGAFDVVNISSTLDDLTQQSASSTPTSSGALRSALKDDGPLGTGFGDATDFSTEATSFVKRNSFVPDALLALYYDSVKGLEKRGIALNYRTRPRPSAFPKYDSTSCTPPSGWDPADRDNLMDDLLDRLRRDNDRDTMYTLLQHVETERLEDAFIDYRKTLKL